jgi:tRNA pseudouridine38-40 synthase
MNKAANSLFDYIDFTSFSKLHSDVKTNNCKIMLAQWIEENGLLVFAITADRFLRNMVRAIVGTLIDVGKGKISMEEFRNIIESKNRCDAGYSVPAKALFLEEIKYPEDIFEL